MSKPMILRIAAGAILVVALFALTLFAHYQTEVSHLLDGASMHLANAERACGSSPGASHQECLIETSYVSGATANTKVSRGNRNLYGGVAVVSMLCAAGLFIASRPRNA